MRNLLITATCLAFLSTTTAQAAQDAGLSVQNYRSAAPQSGVGAQLGVTLKLDSKRVVRNSERVQLGFSAGSVMAVQDARTGVIRRGGGNLAGFSLRPGHSVTLTLAGKPVVKRYTVLGAAEEAEDETGKPEKKDRKGPSTVGWIAIGVGGLIAATLTAGVIALASFEGD